MHSIKYPTKEEYLEKYAILGEDGHYWYVRIFNSYFPDNFIVGTTENMH